MNHPLDKFNTIAVFSNYRYGSSAICNILRNFAVSVGRPVYDWSEYLTEMTRVVSTVDGYKTIIGERRLAFGKDLISVNNDPQPRHITRVKLDTWDRARKDSLIVFKIMPQDFEEGNDSLIYDRILSDPKVYKIGLNREDVSNAAISFLVGHQHEIWHGTKEQFEDWWKLDVRPIPVDHDLLQFYAKHVSRHNMWLDHATHLLDEIVWFDELGALDLPNIGLHGFRDRANRYFTDPDDLLRFLEAFQSEMQPLIDSLKLKT